MTYYFLENFEKYFLETLVQIESNSPLVVVQISPYTIPAQGLAAPLVAQKLLGSTGEYAILFLILMAVMSTGSAEVIAVASIIIYDVYQVRIA